MFRYLFNRKTDESQRRKPFAVHGNELRLILVPMIFTFMFLVPILIFTSMRGRLDKFSLFFTVFFVAVWYGFLLLIA